jgi:hypothetical protein
MGGCIIIIGWEGVDVIIYVFNVYAREHDIHRNHLAPLKSWDLFVLDVGTVASTNVRPPFLGLDNPVIATPHDPVIY